MSHKSIISSVANLIQKEGIDEMDFVYNREAKTDIRDQSNHLVIHGLPLPSPADGFHSPRPQMASAPLALNWPQLPSLEIGFHSLAHTQCTPLPFKRNALPSPSNAMLSLSFKRNALPSPSNAMLSPPLQTQCSPLPFKRNALPPFKRNALPSPLNAMLSPPLQTQCSPLPFKRNALPSPSNAMLSLPFKRNALPSPSNAMLSPPLQTQCSPLPFKRNALPSPSNAMLSPPLQTQCSPLPFKRNALPPLQTQCSPLPFKRNALPSPSNAMPSHQLKHCSIQAEVTNKAALPLADLVTGVGNIATFADCEKEIALLREYSPKVDILPDLRMLEIEINGFRDIPSSQVEEVNNRTTYFQVKRYDLVDQRVMWPMEESAPIIAENERRTQAGEWSEWETAEIKQITQEKAAAMDNEEDKEEEQSEILAEDDIEGEQYEEEPSPAPTNHRALASRRNTSSPTKHPPQPQTLPQLPISPLSTPVALSPIPAFATTPAQHRVINKTMT
ncbi:hypothetical protein BLNAU_15678 [Blattamonas nauphoetae]|uniref:Uncharacterized protein n=1 Tax=Blattamonas nauphoetae TaxID=2049346 RepID=A0ABQ9XDK7_9EUKA|nr:hypothetical protein BLNAU_15678 [Blattamonas nauphoetae]